MTQKKWQHFSISELNNQSTKELAWLEFGSLPSPTCDCEKSLKGGECCKDGQINT